MASSSNCSPARSQQLHPAMLPSPTPPPAHPLTVEAAQAVAKSRVAGRDEELEEVLLVCGALPALEAAAARLVALAGAQDGVAVAVIPVESSGSSRAEVVCVVGTSVNYRGADWSTHYRSSKQKQAEQVQHTSSVYAPRQERQLAHQARSCESDRIS